MRILLHPTLVRLAPGPQRQVVDACDVGASHDDKAPMQSALDHGFPIMNVRATADPPTHATMRLGRPGGWLSSTLAGISGSVSPAGSGSIRPHTDAPLTDSPLGHLNYRALNRSARLRPMKVHM